MGIYNDISWMPPISHPERFAQWSRDVSKLLDFLSHYVAAGRKERILVIPLKAEALPQFVGLNDIVAFYEQHQMQTFILPDQDQDYEQFIEQLQKLHAIYKAYVVKQQREAITSSNQKEDFEQLRKLFRAKGLLRAYYEDYMQIYTELYEKGLVFWGKWEDGGTKPIPLFGLRGEGEPIVTETEVAFETESVTRFSLSLDELLHSSLNAASHTGYLSWRVCLDDFIVKAVLIRLALHFPDIHVSGDQADSIPASWWEAFQFCQQVFGVGDIPRTVTHWMDYVPDEEE